MNDPETHPWPPSYFSREDGLIIPSGLARSPWSRRAIAGGPISALLAVEAQDPELDEDFEIARFTVDILGIVPHQPLEVRIVPMRIGRQTLLHRVELLANGRPAAQAHVLRVRRIETPVIAPPHEYPPAQSVEETDFLGRASMAGAIRARPVSGAVGKPGRGVSWLGFDGEIVRGETPSNFVKSALFGDFGNGIGSATSADDWSYANLDITLQFLRMPIGEWILIDAETHMAGNGHGTVRNIFADAQGVYARGFQTIFVAPGHLSDRLPARKG